MSAGALLQISAVFSEVLYKRGDPFISGKFCTLAPSLLFTGIRMPQVGVLSAPRAVLRKPSRSGVGIPPALVLEFQLECVWEFQTPARF